MDSALGVEISEGTPLPYAVWILRPECLRTPGSCGNPRNGACGLLSSDSRVLEMLGAMMATTEALAVSVQSP